jgi:hypothetical protein
LGKSLPDSGQLSAVKYFPDLSNEVFWGNGFKDKIQSFLDYSFDMTLLSRIPAGEKTQLALQRK